MFLKSLVGKKSQITFCLANFFKIIKCQGTFIRNPRVWKNYEEYRLFLGLKAIFYHFVAITSTYYLSTNYRKIPTQNFAPREICEKNYLIVESVRKFMTHNDPHSPIINAFRVIHIKKRGLQNTRGEHDLVLGRRIISVHGGRRHTPFGPIHEFFQFSHIFKERKIS